MTVKLKPQESTTYRKANYSEGILRSYAVLVDGEEVGRVYQGRAETVQAYSGRVYGYATFRTVWNWESNDNMGDFELATCGEAVEGLVEAVTQ